MTEHATTDDLRAALQAAIPHLTEDQARAALELIDMLTPPMEEPEWPGAPVIAGCAGSANKRLHIRRHDGPRSGWKCSYQCNLHRVGRSPLPPAANTGRVRQAPHPHAVHTHHGRGDGMTDHPKHRPAHTGCPTCGHTTNHDGHAIARNSVRVLDILLDLGWRPGGGQ